MDRIYVVHNFQLGIYGVYTEPEEVIKYLKDKNVEKQSYNNTMSTAMHDIYVFEPNTTDFEDCFTPADFMDQFNK